MAKRTEKSPTIEIVVADTDQPEMPTSAVNQDDNLVDRAASHIRDILARTVSRGLEDVGNYLLETFYENNVDLYQSLKPSKHASLSLLEQRCETLDLPVSRTFLANAIGVAVLSRQLPRSSPFLKLPASHKQELLRADTPEKAEVFAARALEKKLTVQKLRALVREDRGKGKHSPETGRKRKAAVLRVLGACIRLLQDDGSKRLVFRRTDFRELTPQQIDVAREMCETLRKRVDETLKRLGD